jgi:hypothetical protein
MNRAIKIIMILAIALLAGCYYDTEERLYPNIYNPCDDKVVTYSKTVTTILHPCLSCHSNSVAVKQGGGIKLENIDAVITYVKNGRLMGSVTHDKKFIPMPNGGGKLPDCEIAQLQKWINNQTPNN